MAKIITINQNYQFRKMYRIKSMVAPVLVTYVKKNNLGYNRIGITASKKVGKAHHRNRARRVVREAYRLLSAEITATNSWDIVFVVRARTCHCKMSEVHKAMRNHFIEKAVIHG